MAAQLVAIGELFAYRLSRCSDTEEWAIDTMDAVAAEVGAALRITQRGAIDRVRYARALRERLPKIGELFKAGGITYPAFQTIAFRTELIDDRDVLATVDAELAVKVPLWPSLSKGRLSAQVDRIVIKADADAVRRRKERQVSREVWIGDALDGLSRIEGTLFTADARALNQRLSALAATVCDRDPRTREERRADALGALAAGADRLGCRCGHADCAAGGRPAASPVTIHVIAEHATVTGEGGLPGSIVCADGLITAELVGRVGEVGQGAAAGASRLGAAGGGLCAVQGVGRFRAVPGFDVSLAGLRPPRSWL